MSLDLDRKSDAELIAAVRGGDSEAYGVLYERHLHAAKRAASCLSNTAAEREDLVADAFTRVLRVLRDGRGPNEEFRAYLLVTMRNAAISGSRGASVSLYADVPETYLPNPGGDPVENRWNASTAATAFASLPERWRTVLWHTEVEEESPAEIAPLLGMSANGVAALAYRAREGLRQAYLRAHLRDVDGRECQATVSKLAGWVRRSVPVPLGRKISRHLAVCADCQARAETLTRVNQELRASVAPLLLGAAFAAAYVPVVAAPVSGAAGAVVAKTLFAKVAVATAIAATAVTTVASAPNFAEGDPRTLPVIAEPTQSTDSIQGPGGTKGKGTPVNDPALDPSVTTTPTTLTTSTEVAPESGTGESEEDTEATDTATTTSDKKAEKEAAKEEKKADKEEAKASREAEKEEKKAEKGK
ncbi:sigma-70 family RNA polymerase sigma factor [Actinophytocola sp.]|uniref:RNA polymerase sigma factor n=1 Tax=Actinophytocola sp. TaxID=1872138 RepID=UPI002ECFFF71